MSPKALSVLAKFFAACLLLTLAVLYLHKRRPPQSLLWPKADKEAVQAIEITKGEEKIVFRRSQAQWVMSEPLSYPADGAALSGLLDQLSKVELSEPLTDNPKKHSLFEVEGPSAVEVRIGEALHFFIGKQADRYDSVYLRRAQGPEVLAALGLSRYELGKSSFSWLDKTIVSIPKEGLQSLTVRSSGKTASLKFPQVLSSTAAAALLKPLLDGLSPFQADQIVFHPGKFAAESEIRLEWLDPSGRPQKTSIKMGKEKDGLVPVVWEGEERVGFLIYPWKADPFLKLTGRSAKVQSRP